MLTAAEIRDGFLTLTWVDSNGETHFGRPERYHPDYDFESHLKDGIVVVADDIYPCLHLLPLADVAKGDYEKGWEHQQAELDKALEFARSLDADDPKLRRGDVFSVGVADGYAWYIVTKVHRKNADVEWRGFGADGYRDHFFRLGGRFLITEIRPRVQRHRERTLPCLKPLVAPPSNT